MPIKEICRELFHYRCYVSFIRPHIVAITSIKMRIHFANRLFSNVKLTFEELEESNM